jgi:chemotaxis protein methyltransferase CheR
VEDTREIDPATRRAFFDQVRRHTGIAMSERKWTMLEGRLRRRLNALSLTGYRDYLRMLDEQPDEVRDFIDLVTTNETSFFRTPRIWEYFSQQFLPQWFEAHRGTTLRLWSAASSTGEEAYTTAMMCEAFRTQHPAFRYQIVGTDISDAVVRQASLGLYRGRNADALSAAHPELVQKHFTARDDGLQANAALRANVSFRQHNLYHVPRGIGPVDLAFLRNVLIYFDADGQQAVLENVRRAMVPNGVLIVGESESLSRFETGFGFEQPLIYRNRGADHGQQRT